MSRDIAKSNKNPLKLHIENNFPVKDMVSIEMFSFEELSEFEVEKIFINTYEPLNGAAANKTVKLSILEQCELSELGLIKPLFIAAQLNNAYRGRANPVMGTSQKPIADLELFNSFIKNSNEKKIEDALCLEEAHSYLYAEISKDKHIHCYSDPLTGYNKDTLSILDSKVLYKKFNIKDYSLYQILGDLVGFDTIQVPKVAIFVDMVDSNKSAFILKIHDMIHFLEKDKNEERFTELELKLAKNRNKSEITSEQSGNGFTLTEGSVLSYRSLLKSALASDSIDRIKKFNLLEKYVLQ